MRRRGAVAGLLVLVLLLAGASIFFFSPVSVLIRLMDWRLDVLGVESHTVPVAGIRVHYFVMGPKNGKPIVLMHGLGGRAEDWRNLAPRLTDAGYRVYFPDLPGYGRSDCPGSFSYSVPDEAEVVLGLLDGLGLQRVALGGLSMGGWIAQRIAIDHPERVDRLILFDSVGLKIPPDWDTRLFTPGNEDELARLNALLTPTPKPVPEFIAKDVLRLSSRKAWVIRRALASMLSGKDVTDADLPHLKMPVLLVWGSLDRIVPLHQGEIMHQLIPQSQLDVINGCGHLAPVQCSAQIEPGLEKFLAQ